MQGGDFLAPGEETEAARAPWTNQLPLLGEGVKQPETTQAGRGKWLIHGYMVATPWTDGKFPAHTAAV